MGRQRYKKWKRLTEESAEELEQQTFRRGDHVWNKVWGDGYIIGFSDKNIPVVDFKLFGEQIVSRKDLFHI